MMEETYLRSIDDPKGILECYERYGAVGITGVLSKDECAETIEDVKRIIQSLGATGDFDINDPATYEKGWPDMASYINLPGVVGKHASLTPILNRNRFHPNVKKAYSIVYQRPASELTAQFDRIGWMRPVVGKDGESFEQYATPYKVPGMHLDVDPVYYFDESKLDDVLGWLNNLKYDTIKHLVSENNAKNIKMGRHCQGVLNLIDNLDENGGFKFCPGGHNIIQDWYKENVSKFVDSKPNGRYFFNESDHQFSKTARIPCPAGTLIIFDASLPHGTSPNKTGESRIIQFLRYMPKDVFTKETFKKREKLLSSLCKNVVFKLEE
jgi:hypothetical protein